MGLSLSESPIPFLTACHLLMARTFRPGALQLVCLQPWPYYLPSFNQLAFQSLDFTTWIHVVGGVLIATLGPPFFCPSSDPSLQWLPRGNQGLAWGMRWIWAVAASLCVFSSSLSMTFFSRVQDFFWFLTAPYQQLIISVCIHISKGSKLLCPPSLLEREPIGSELRV